MSSSVSRWYEEFASVLAEPDPTVSLAAQGFLGRLADPSVLRELVGAVGADDPATKATAEASYRHVLGFDKLVLLDCHDDGQLRLHVWWPHDTRGREHIHNHRFPFASRVVVGRMGTELYQRGDVGVPLQEYRETSEVHQHRWRFDPVGSVRLELTLTAELAAGSAYRLAADALHRVDVVPGDLVVTVMLQPRLARQWSAVFVDPAAPPQPAPQTRFDTAEVRRRLQDVVDVLA